MVTRRQIAVVAALVAAVAVGGCDRVQCRIVTGEPATTTTSEPTTETSVFVCAPFPAPECGP